MDDFFLLLCVVAFFILAFGLVSHLVKEKLFLSEPTVSIIFGIIIGPNILNLVSINYIESKNLLYQFARIVLCVQIMTAAMSLPQGYVLKNSKSLCILILVVSWFKYMISFSVIYFMTGYNVAISLAIAACLTPTDPVLSSSVVKSKFADENVPERLRFLISAESGINDGIGLPFLFIPIHLFYSTNLAVGLQNFIFKTIFYECIFSALIGIVIGYISRKALKYCYSNDLVGTESFLVYGIALTFFCLGLMEVLKSSEMVCIFFTGTVFAWDEWFVLETRESRLQEVVDSIFSVSFFIFFGSRINFSKISATAVVASIVIIFLRRPIPCLMFQKYIKPIKNGREALFVGWFGPIGVGALFYALMVDKILSTLTIDFVSTVVLMSTFIHGLTIPLFKLGSFKTSKEFLDLNIAYKDSEDTLNSSDDKFTFKSLKLFDV